MRRAATNRVTKDVLSNPGADRLIHVRLTEDLHRSLRVHVAANDTTIQEWVAALIARELGSLAESARQEVRRK
jgi:hypothetical protein